MKEKELENLLLMVGYPRMLHTNANEIATDLFIQGVSVDLALAAGGNASLAVDAEHLYYDAFNAGSDEAGINLLGLLICTTPALFDDGVEDYPQKDKFGNVYLQLKGIGHPVIPYYGA